VVVPDAEDWDRGVRPGSALMLQPEIADEMMSVIAAADNASLVLSAKGVFIVILALLG